MIQLSTYAEIIKKKKKEWNCEGLMDGHNTDRGQKLPFSSPLMNWATYGGIPRNKITEFFGDPGGGKSSTAVDICKNCIEIFNKEYSDKVDSLREQIASGNKSAVSELADLEDFGPKKVLYIDLEHSFDAAWSKTLGIDESDIDVMQPPDTTAEEIMQTILDIIETGEVGMIVLDSIPSLVPKMELEKNIGERTVSALAGPLSVFCRKVVSLLTRYQCTLLMINQVRDNMDNPYVVNTPGGKAPKFYSSLRIQFRIGAPVDFLGIEQPQKFESPAGYLIKAQIVKQKSAPWDRKQATYYLMCKSGIRPDFDYANLAINKYGVICKKAAWFTFTDPQTGEVLENESGMPVKVNGLARVYDYLKEHPDYYNKLKEYITNDINGASSDE